MSLALLPSVRSALNDIYEMLWSALEPLFDTLYEITKEILIALLEPFICVIMPLVEWWQSLSTQDQTRALRELEGPSEEWLLNYIQGKEQICIGEILL